VKKFLLTVLVLVGSLVLTLLVFGVPLGPALRVLWDGAFGSEVAWSRTAVKMTPLLLAGLGMTLAWKAGMYNIGGEGQFIGGGLLAAVLFHLAPGFSLPWVLLLVSCVGGLVWALLAGWLQVKRGVQLVISTILLNFVITQLLSYAVSGPLKDPVMGAFLTPKLPDSSMLLRFNRQTDLHSGVILALVLAVGVWFFLSRTKPGFLIRVAGQNPRVLRTHRISAERIQLLALAISGALCGLAGGVEYTGMSGQIGDSFSQNWGFLAIPVALLGGLNPLGVCLSAFYFGALFAGTQALERKYSADSAIILVIQAVAVLAVLGIQAWSRNKVVEESA